MKQLLDLFDVRKFLGEDEWKPTLILLSTALLLTVHRYFGSMEFARSVFSAASSFDVTAYMFAAAFILLGAIPAAVVRFGFRHSLREYGLQWGNWRLGLTATAVLFPVLAGALLYPGSQTAEMRSVYPFDANAGSSLSAFLRFEAVRAILFYTAWEFFFRGFMLFGLRKYVGDWMAICIQTLPSCLWHIGMPTGEIFSSIAGGVLFGMMAVRTCSILWPLLLHILIGVALDYFIVMTS